MTIPIQKPTTDEIANVCNLVEQALHRFLFARDEVPTWGRYEAQDETHIILLYCFRCIESVLVLARQDLVLLPSALILARTIADGSIKVLWMLQSDDLFECEARWLTFAGEETSYFSRLAGLFQDVDAAYAERMHSEEKSIKGFYDDVKTALDIQSRGVYRVRNQMPDMRSLLKMLNIETDYWKYMLGSQFTHVSPVATGLYRKNMGTKKRFGEFVEPENWLICFEMIWPFFQQAASLFLKRYGGSPDRFCTEQQDKDVLAAIRAIK